MLSNIYYEVIHYKNSRVKIKSAGVSSYKREAGQ